MSWDQKDFLARLTQAVDAFDGEKTAKLCQELGDRLADGEVPEPGLGRNVLAVLRRKCYFAQMETVADLLHETGADDDQVRRQFAQALIDQGKIPAAAYVLELLVGRTAGNDPAENAEAWGLLGRIHKQRYVNAVRDDPQAARRSLSRRHLQSAVEAYHGIYQSDPARYLWQGINSAALLRRAKADGVELEGTPDGEAMAREILGRLQARHAEQGDALDAWSRGTAMEASLALGDVEQAQLWLGRYVQAHDADAFELAGTERQLREIWGLTVEEPPGSLLLPVIQSAALKRRFGRVELFAPQVHQTIQETHRVEETFRAEKTFGTERYVPLGWYRMGLERCRGVAQIKDQFGRGLGTGFLLRGTDFAPELGDGFLVLTNHHVVPRAVAARDAVVVFEALETAVGQTFRVVQQLWTSPFEELDATLLQLDRPVPVPGPEPFPIAETVPDTDTDKDPKPKVYVIGHPLGGGLSLSLTDNALLGTSDRLLHYRAPTEGGSSGSPVFDDSWRLIALHHGGGTNLKRLDGKDGRYDANEGIHIQRVLEAVRAAGPALKT